MDDAAAALVGHLGAAAPPGPLLTEWNPWWPYEDADITEQVFLDNAAVAARLGFDVAVLDAGWFGRADAGTDWFAERGDWHRTNTARFPHGLGWLADRTRDLGIDFGVESQDLGDRDPGLVGDRGQGVARFHRVGLGFGPLLLFLLRLRLVVAVG